VLVLQQNHVEYHYEILYGPPTHRVAVSLPHLTNESKYCMCTCTPE